MTWQLVCWNQGKTMATDSKVDKGESWRFIGDNVPTLEIIGPHSNQYRIFVEDVDGDIIGLLPKDAKKLITRLEQALETIRERRMERLKKTA